MVKEGRIGRSVGGTYALHSVRAAFSNFPHLFLLRRPPPKMDLAMDERRAACLGQIILKLATEQTAIGTEGGRATQLHCTLDSARVRTPTPTPSNFGGMGRKRTKEARSSSCSIQRRSAAPRSGHHIMQQWRMGGVAANSRNQLDPQSALTRLFFDRSGLDLKSACRAPRRLVTVSLMLQSQQATKKLFYHHDAST